MNDVITFITNIAHVAQKTWVFVVGCLFSSTETALASQTVWAQIVQLWFPNWW